MRCASFNVQSGGINGYDPTAAYPQRMGPIKEAVHELNADVVGLVDTYRWVELFGDEGVVSEFSELGFTDARCINLGGMNLEGTDINKLGVTILSKESMRNVRTIDMAGRNALAAQVSKGDEELEFASVYLDYYQEETRVRQARGLLADLDLSRPTVIAGDLNAINRNSSPRGARQLGGAALRGLPKLNQLHRIVADMTRGDVMQTFKEAGLVDADPQQQPTLRVGRFGLFALDHALYSPEHVQVTDFVVPTGGVYMQASDHFPIVFEAQPLSNVA